MRPEGSAYFVEVQHFRQLWLWLVMAVVNVALLWSFGRGCYQQLIQGEPWGERPMSDVWLVLVSLAVVGVVGAVDVLLARMRMETRVDSRGVHILFRPMVDRWIEAAEIQAFEAVTYRPIREYGGWGVRGIGKKRAFNVSGNRGVQLVLTDGKRLLLGSQRPEELESALVSVTGLAPGIES